jgi:hypothetical protein
VQQLEIMGKHGRELVGDKYDIKAVGKQMVELYNTI